MKRILLVCLLLIAALQLYSVYEVGDVVDDFTWLESDGGEPVSRSLYELIDDNKVVFLFFGGLG